MADVASDISGLGQFATAAKGILGMFFADKTEEERSKIAAAFAMLQGQLDINKTEAASPDPLEHWRGAMGWVCALSYFNNFILVPWGTALGLHFPVLDLGQLSMLTAGMLGLGGMHVYQQVNK